MMPRGVFGLIVIPMHSGDHDSSVIGQTHIDRMTAGLSSKLEPQSSYDPDQILAGK